MPAKVIPLSFCITLCSRQRPVLLKRALTSLCALEIPENVSLSFVLVENNETQQYADIVSEFSAKMPLTYVLEPRAGLTYARNKILETLQGMRADWVGSVDDDQIIFPDWLIQMVTAIQQYPDTHMFVGNWRRIRPASMPDWYPSVIVNDNIRDGAQISTGGANYAYHFSVIDENAHGLKFDMAYNLIGGEDTDFSKQYTHTGGIIRYVKRAITEEDIHPERATLKARLTRSLVVEYNLAKIRHQHSNAVIALLWSLQIFYRCSTLGIINMVLAGGALPFREKWAMRRYGVSLRFFWQAAGVVRYYFGQQEELYRHIDGN